MNPENQFDFWLGEWDVAWGNDEKGMSVSSYDPERQLWCQTWVDSNDTYLEFTGRFEDGKMILSRDASVRSQTWRALWQIHYTRR